MSAPRLPGHPPLAAGWIDRPHHRTAIGNLPLESGELLQDCALVWVEHGTRRTGARNTILICCAIGSTHHRLDFLIGPGRALDTDRYHLLVVDALGNGLSTSPSNSRSQADAAFPIISIRDMVESQRRLLDALGIDRLHAVVGASMGGMQALQWGVGAPERADRIVAMTPMARTSRWSQLVNELSRRALFEDAACTRPRRRDDAMRLWAPLTQLIVPTTPASVSARFDSEFALLDWLHEREATLAQYGPNPFDWLAQTRAYDAHDIGQTPGFDGDTDRALQSIRAAALVLAPDLDLFNPADDARRLAQKIPAGQFDCIPSIHGHQSASGIDRLDIDWLDRRLGEFLDPGKASG
jgi:homoserine O-acetyltransferase